MKIFRRFLCTLPLLGMAATAQAVNLDLSLESSSATVNEDAGTITLNVTATNPGVGAFTATVDYQTLPGSATSGFDYTTTAGVLSFNESDLSEPIVIPITNDTIVEDAESFSVQLSNPQGGTSTPTMTVDATAVTIIDDDVEAPIGAPVIQNLPLTVAEDIGTTFVTVSRVGGSSGTLVATYSTSDLTANSPEDYVSQAGTLTWGDGDTSDRTISISIIDDSLDEDDESLNLTLTDDNEPNAPVSGQITITDNDANAVVEFSDTTLSVNEADGTITLSVTRTGNSSGSISVQINTMDGSAGAGSDYVANAGVLTWADGESDDRTIVVGILDDVSIEEDENFTAVLTNPVGQVDLGQNNPATVTIVSDDEPNPGEITFADTPLSVDEAAGTTIVTLRRINGTDGDLTVLFTTTDGTATSPADYITAEVEVTWPDGDDSDRTVEISVLEDDIVEGDETLTLSLSNVNDPSVADVTEELTILDNDVNAELAFFELSVSASEEAGVATVTVTRTGNSTGEVSVDVIAQDGTAASPDDYRVPTETTITWLSGETGPRTIDITIIDDDIDEEEETFEVSLANVTGPASLGADTTATVAIVDNDVNAELAFFELSVSASEEAGVATVSVTRSGSSAGEVSVDVIARDGTASSPEDYRLPSTNTLTWLTGETGPRTIEITIVDDAIDEDEENFIVSLENVTGPASLGADTSATVVIVDNDPSTLGGPQFVTTSVETTEEAGTVTLTVLRDGDPSGPLTVDYSTENGSATAPDDFTAVSGTLTWADGDASTRTIEIPILEDGVVEGDELFIVNLDDLTDPTAPRVFTRVTIVDNDVNAALEFIDLTVNTSEQDDTVTVTVTRSGNATGPVTVDFATEDGSATAPDDYASAGGTLSWGDGELGERNIVVTIEDDNVTEDEEDFTINLSNITGQASLGANSAITVLISASDGQRNISELSKLNSNQQQIANWFDRTCPRLSEMDGLTAEQQDLADICQSIRNIETSDEEVCAAIDEIMPNELFVSSFNALKLTAIQHGNLSQRINALRNGATGIDLAGLDIEINGEVIAGNQIEEFVNNLVGGAAGAEGLNWGKWGAFIDGRIVTGEKDKGDLEDAFDFDIYGFTAGIDYRIKQNFIVGGAVGYGVVDSDFQGSGGGMDIESVTASAFLTYFNDSTYYFDAMATWGRNDYESKRNINFSAAGIDIQRRAIGKTDGSQYSFGFGSGFDFSNGPLTYGPHAGAYYFNVASDSFTERGASGLELVVGDQRSESLTANLGGHISYAVTTDWGVFVPNARVDWVNEFKDNRETLSFNFLHDPFANDPTNPSPGIKIRTDRPDSSYFIWSVGVHTQLIYGLSGFIDYKSFSSYDNLSLQEVSWGMRWEKTW